MKQIIPFKKELLFSTKINEITSISLEHTISLKDDNVIKGNFIITGDYKMTASSINKEVFNFSIPVEIDLDDSYDYDKAVIDIDNFYYEIVNDDSIRVNIDLYVEAEKKIIDEINENVINNDDKEELFENNDYQDRTVVDIDSDVDINTNNDLDNDVKIESTISFKEPEYVDINNSVDDTLCDEKANIFNVDGLNSETYTTYYVYIVKENDTVGDILNKFNVSKEELSNYNDIMEIKRGDKLIIPINNE